MKCDRDDVRLSSKIWWEKIKIKVECTSLTDSVTLNDNIKVMKSSDSLYLLK